MGSPVIRKGVDNSTGHSGFPPVPAIQAASNVKVNGIGVVRQGDKYAVHCNSGSCHQGSATGSSTVKANGRGVTTRGKPITCGDTSSGGSSNVKAGG
jgi:uncharacterized Zn-binding protein involved in type VI secretion